ncbi:BTAD domain-containing putative transcriptional regulator [Variovorax sp. KK3]|uniref:BTAD domain-containing putative transcriptional regulator n=1 Tax=Variovorax sp. KK3 TaxID=1855728 RepID=UPI00097C86FE|nr:BTAD domain-containing putative transcriptional regulator [Variovorax sp. KK3]
MAGKQVTLAKISRPRLHDVLARTRLFTLLDKAARQPVVWLAAQPGAGKTTLLAGHLEARKRGGIWYQVDAADADPASFIYHLRLAASAAGAGDRLPLLTPEYLPDLRGFARRFFRDLYAGLGADAVLVLDNFQDVPEGAGFHAIVAEGMAQVPDGANVFVLSRAEPPAAYAGLLAGDAMALVDGEALRLTPAETRAIARKRGVADEARVDALQLRSHGWAAGLTLLLARARQQPTGVPDEDDAESLQHVFGYFAQRVFDGTAPEHRRALMQLAFLPLMTVPLAEQLTGLPEAGRLLDHHYKRHLFTDRRRVAQPAAGHVFQFHALFRSFLQHQARAAWGADELRAVAARAAQLLEAEGHGEQAFALYEEAGDGAACARLAGVQAEGLLQQGRRQTLLDWLARIPPAERERDPWLGYWEGRALMAIAPDRALQVLQARHQRFAESGDAVGQLACGAAVVQTLWFARLGWSEVAPWADRLEPLMAGETVFPTRSIELMSLTALHAALAFCRLGHPAVRSFGPRLLALVGDDAIDWNQRLVTATHLITYFHNAAEHELALRLIGQVDPAVETLPASALNRAFWYIFRAIHDLRQADFEASSMRFQRAEDLAREEGLLQAEFAAMQFHAYLDLTFRRAAESRARIARMEVHPARGSRDAEMNYFVARTMLAQLQGETQAALGYAKQGLEAVERVGAAYFQAVFPPLYVSALAEGGEAARALAIVERSRALSRGNYLEAMEAQLLLEEAYVAHVQGDAARTLRKLAEGFALAAADRTRAAYAHRAVTRKPVLLHLAIAHGIELELVRGLIRRWRIEPPSQELPHWPWPVRVRTLGGFELRVDDRPVEFGRKAPRKTLALLKAVVARGGAAPEGVLLDTFWPDETGDAAARSLAAAVRRLRGLLGTDDAVVQQGGQLSLDRALVWVDAWAFERVLATARAKAAADGTALGEALALYRGAFLAEEEGESWPVAQRERLRGKFIQAVADHASALEHAQRPEEAIAFYLRGLEADDVVEPFYQGLMRCYHRLDRLPEAVSAYRRLKQTLSVTLSLPPSAGTEKLYRSLRLAQAEAPPIRE